MVLTEEQRAMVRRVFAQGPAVMLESGMDMLGVKEQMSDTDFKDYFGVLETEFDHQDALETRNRFIARRQLSQMIPNAVAICGMSMAGPQYLTHIHTTPDGQKQEIVTVNDKTKEPILARPEPTSLQFQSAKFLMECAGVPAAKARLNDGMANLSVLFKSEDAATRLSIDPDPLAENEKERCLSRERVRNVIEVITNDLPAIVERVDDVLMLAAPESVPEGTKKKARKKVARKKVTKTKVIKKSAKKAKTRGRKKKA